jgi:hypothetical protein
MSDLSAAQLADLVAKAKVILRLDDDDQSLAADGLYVFNNSSDSTAATVQVTDTTVVLVITGGADAGTTTLTLSDAANDTLTELTSVIDGTTGWTAQLLGKSDVDSGLLIPIAATACKGEANRVTLQYVNNELLELLITNMWAVMETSIGRGLLSTTYTQTYDIRDTPRELLLDEPDLTQITMLATEVEDGLRVKYTGSDTHARVEVTSTAVVLSSRAGGTTTTTTTLFSDQATTTLMASTLNAVSGWTATVSNDAPSAFLVQQGARDAKDTEQVLEAWVDYDEDYETDYGAGILKFCWPPIADRGDAYVVYVAGFASIPADIEQVVLALVKDGWDATSKDSSVTKEKIGDYAYELGEAVSGTGGGSASLEQYEEVLARYRRVRV